MKIKLLFIMVILPVLLISVSLSDYTFPKTFYQEAYLSGNFNLASGNQDQTSYNGAFQGDYDINYSSLPLSWRLGVDANLDLMQGSNEDDDSETAYNVTAFSNADKYFNNTDVFGYGSLNFGYRKTLGADDADDPYTKIGVGAGYGRVINATVLAKAMRVVEDLNKYNVLSGQLSDDLYLELAQVIDKENEFESKYGPVEYQKYWFEAMEKILMKSGKLKDDALGALGLIRIQEVFGEKYGVRKHGWTVRGGLGFVLSNYDGSESDPSLDASFEYALPYSYRMQLNEKLDYSTILSDDIVHQITNNLSLTYELSNRIDWENSLVSSFTIPTEENLENIINNTLTSSFYYYLANQLTLNTKVSFNKYDDGVDDNGNDDIETSINMGITYRIR